MNLIELENNLKNSNLLSFTYFFDNSIKRYFSPSNFVSGVWDANTFGIYKKTDGTFVVYINDNERGLPEISRIFKTEEEACVNLYEEVNSCNVIYQEKIIKTIRLFIQERTSLKQFSIEQNCDSFRSHFDIGEEFAKVIRRGGFLGDLISVEGYTAKQLYETTSLSLLGAYNYLIYLREEPAEALADLKAGLPRK